MNWDVGFVFLKPPGQFLGQCEFFKEWWRRRIKQICLDIRFTKVSTLCLGVILLHWHSMFKVFFGVLLIHFIDWSPFPVTSVPSQPYSQSKPQRSPLSLEGGSPSSLPMPSTPPKPKMSRSALDYTLLFTFMYYFLAVLGLRCCAQAFSSCSEILWAYSFLQVLGNIVPVPEMDSSFGVLWAESLINDCNREIPKSKQL